MSGLSPYEQHEIEAAKVLRKRYGKALDKIDDLTRQRDVLRNAHEEILCTRINERLSTNAGLRKLVGLLKSISRNVLENYKKPLATAQPETQTKENHHGAHNS